MKNSYKICGDITIIYINRPSEGIVLECLIDTEDLPSLQYYPGTWTVNRDRSGNYYARTSEGQAMHRVIMKAPKEVVVDHINHNTLDNRKSQLRLATLRNNARNRKGATKLSKSGIRGVGWDSKVCKWRVVVWVDGKNKHLGYYEDKYEAGRVSTKARLEYFGSSYVDRIPIKLHIK